MAMVELEELKLNNFGLGVGGGQIIGAGLEELDKGCALFAITSKILRFSTEHIHSKDSSDSRLQIDYTCPVEILDVLEVIAKIGTLK